MGVAASAKEVQEVVKAVNDVIDLLKKLDRERSAVLEVQNLTTSTLRRVSDNHDDGGFAESPSAVSGGAVGNGRVHRASLHTVYRLEYPFGSPAVARLSLEGSLIMH